MHDRLPASAVQVNSGIPVFLPSEKPQFGDDDHIAELPSKIHCLKTMFSGRSVRWVIHALDWAAARVLPPEQIPEHQRIGRKGEEDAYFYLRKLGYVMVARNFRSPRRRGELDLIAWKDDVLCFVEVKTRTTRDVKPAELAVDYDKQRELKLVGREYLRLLTATPQYRFDIVTVYYERGKPEFEVFQNAFPVS